ncbi:MAG: M20/M25/M40 family metallo-hydrolase [Rhodospirillaceae bacterium]|nr:M20/M25/M40 family metallo-hydrolase [Rhodospirillaceae bacterium]
MSWFTPRRLARYKSLLIELIGVRSPHGAEAPAAAWTARQLADIGVTADLFDPPLDALADHPGFTPTGSDFANRPCVCARVPGTGSGRSLILNAHLDTAPVDPDARWRFPPHQGVEAEGRIYGRGAWDDKAGVVMALALAEAFRDAPRGGDLILHFVCDDEMGGNGSLAALERGYVGDGAVILDGTWPERLITDHMGQLWMTLTLRGVAAPACNSARGKNPLDAVGDLIVAMNQRERQWRAPAPQSWGTAVNPQFLTVGQVVSGGGPFAVPAAARLACQAGFLPPRSFTEVRAEIATLVQTVLADHDYGTADYDMAITGFDPLIWADANPLARRLQRVLEARTTRPVRRLAVTGHCDLRHFHRLGIPACLHGPGGGENAHIENEFYHWPHFLLVAENMLAFMAEWMTE